MQFTLGMPFLGVLGQFYRNRKGLKSSDRINDNKYNINLGLFLTIPWLQKTLNTVYRGYLSLPYLYIIFYFLFFNK